MPRITQIVSQLPPILNGVGDYCRNLWEHWPQSRPDWRFLSADSADEARRVWAGECAARFKDSVEGIMAGLEASGTDIAMLHYVGYGLHYFGTPFWLPPGLAAWKQRGPHRRLVVMFHELYTVGSVFKKAFWKQPWTRGIVRDLVRLADGWATSCPAHETKLLRQFHADPARGIVIPIGSNIPVTAPVDFQRGPGAGGKLKVVVFGLANTRFWSFQQHERLLITLARRRRLHSVTLLGKKEESPKNLAWLAALREAAGPEAVWEEHADLDAGTISEILSRQDFGLLANTPDTLTKSGVFAALAMHGVIPVVSARADQALPALGGEGALRNEDSPASISAVDHALADVGATRALRLGLQRLAAEKLSWPGITASWEKFLHRPALDLFDEKSTAPRALNL